MYILELKHVLYLEDAILKKILTDLFLIFLLFILQLLEVCTNNYFLVFQA